jgi:hypothetical protein
VRELDDGGRLVAEDLADGRRLGDLDGDLMPLFVIVDGTPFVVLAGAAIGTGVDSVEIASTGLDGMSQACRVKNGVWMSFPHPFTEGMTIMATWRDGECVLFERSATLRSDALEPIFGPGWTSYAPLDGPGAQRP